MVFPKSITTSVVYTGARPPKTTKEARSTRPQKLKKKKAPTPWIGIFPLNTPPPPVALTPILTP